MFNFIHKIIYWFLSIQEQLLRQNLRRTLGGASAKAASKTAFLKSDSFKVKTNTDKCKDKLDSDVKIVLKKYENDPDKLLKFVERNGTRVCKIAYAHGLLKLIGYEEGLIGSLKGIKALYLSGVLTILGKQVGLSLKTIPMFVMSKQPVDSYNTIQQFHKWYAMKLNLPGFDAEAQANFQKFLGSTSDNDIKALTVDEILALKDAIARDVEAINFVVELAKSTDGTRNAMGKITSGEGASI